MISAVVFVPAGPETERWLAICAEYCANHRYEIVAVATIWDDVTTVLEAREAELAIVARRDHLPADRQSRLEVIAEASTAPTDQTQRRPRRTRVAS